MSRSASLLCASTLRLALLALLVPAFLLSACDSSEVAPAPTQVTLEIDSNDSVLLAALTHLRVSVALEEGSGWRARRAVEVPATALHWPVDIPVTPRSEAEADARFEVVVQALADGRVLAETRAIAGFKRNEHRTLKLRLFLCPGHELEAGYTCAEAACQGVGCRVCAANGQCLPVTQIDPADLPLTAVEMADAGAAEDAGAQDATPLDAGLDAEADATQAPAEASTDAQSGLDGAPSDAGDGMDGGLGEAATDASIDASADAASDAAPADASDGSTACQANFKRCGSACIPVAQCCVQADCATGTLCRQGTCKRWCEEQTRPVDVLAADYQCLDFEQGLPAAASWARSTADTAMLATTSDRAFSLPMSVRTSGAAALTWSTTGSTRVTSFTFSAAVNPIQHPTVLPEPLVSELFCLSIGELATSGSVLEQCLMYTYKGDVNGIPNYTGLYIRKLIIAGAALTQEAPLYDSATSMTPLLFNTNVWNALTISIGSDIQVTLNGKTATTSGGTGQDTKAIVSFGVNDWTVNYDNVVVSVRR